MSQGAVSQPGVTRAVTHVHPRETFLPSVSRTNISFMEFLQKMLLIRNVIPTIKTLEVLHIYRAISEEVHQMQPVIIIPSLYTQHSRCYIIIHTRCCLFLILLFVLFYINYDVEVPPDWRPLQADCDFVAQTFKLHLCPCCLLSPDIRTSAHPHSSQSRMLSF